MINLKGLYVAIVTPFKSGKIDKEGLKANLDFLIKNGVSGIVPCGTTGESPTLSWEEHKDVVKTTIEYVNKRCSVIAGAGSNNTAEAVSAAKYAKDAGADAVLVITPYYNKPTQQGLYQHFKAVAQEADIPVVLYNVPGRTGVNLKPSTVKKLCEIKNIIGIKEASGDITQVCEIKRLCGDKITVLSGEDAVSLPILSAGGMGVISVVGNIVPKEMSDMIKFWHEGEIKKSYELHMKLFNLCQSMFYETNPIPVKTAMNALGLAAGDFRLPLVSMSEENKSRLFTEMEKFGLKIKN